MTSYNDNGESTQSGWVKGTTSACPAAANDDFDSAKTLGSLPFTDTMEISGATAASDEPQITGCNLDKPTKSVWYKLTPASVRALHH